MPQGRMKKKASVPQPQKKQRQGVKKRQMKSHRGQYIAPKKPKAVASVKLQKFLGKSIKANIEAEVSSKALSIEPKKFHLVKLSQQTSGRLVKKKK